MQPGRAVCREDSGCQEIIHGHPDSGVRSSPFFMIYDSIRRAPGPEWNIRDTSVSLDSLTKTEEEE